MHSTADATGFVRDLMAQHGDGVTDLEVRRPSLEDTYMTLVHEHETGGAAGAGAGSAVSAFERVVA